MKHKETLPEQVQAFCRNSRWYRQGIRFVVLCQAVQIVFVCCGVCWSWQSRSTSPSPLCTSIISCEERRVNGCGFCEALCTRWNVPLHMVRCDVNAYAEQHHASIETAARACRYAAFSAIPANHIATAHTASDNLETMLHRLIRGSGLRGLAGIPAVRERYIRPC